MGETMILSRRQVLELATGAVAFAAISRSARAQIYPTRPVRIIVGFPAGGPSDITARLIAQWLSERLGQEFVVENRPGAASNIASEAALRAPPDGYTLLLVTSTNAVNATFYEHLSFNFMSDITPVAGIIRVPFVMEINPSIPAKTVPEFIAYAKANPGKINMASGGIGTSVHIAGELFKMMAGVSLVHVPYRGSAPALTDMISGQVHVMFDILTSSIQHIRSGALRALAVTSASRSEALPDLPTVGDFLPGYEATAWYGIAAPKNTPREIVDKLNNEINAGLADPKIKARFADLASTVIPGSPTDFERLVGEEIEKWGKVVKFSGAKPE
jgi:tripartite-type tricarboxylate transporter receptor subunit TctC